MSRIERILIVVINGRHAIISGRNYIDKKKLKINNKIPTRVNSK